MDEMNETVDSSVENQPDDEFDNDEFDDDFINAEDDDLDDDDFGDFDDFEASPVLPTEAELYVKYKTLLQNRI